jgi:hypothetical protein
MLSRSNVVSIELTGETDGGSMTLEGRSHIMRATPLAIATSLALGALILGSDVSNMGQVRAQQAVKKVDMGDYEPMDPWPKPLPDTDLSHDGWTWGSGAGVGAESPD